MPLPPLDPNLPPPVPFSSLFGATSSSRLQHFPIFPSLTIFLLSSQSSLLFPLTLSVPSYRRGVGGGGARGSPLHPLAPYLSTSTPLSLSSSLLRSVCALSSQKLFPFFPPNFSSLSLLPRLFPSPPSYSVHPVILK